MVAVGDALCHTDPSFAYGLSFSLIHARALAREAAAGHTGGDLTDAYLAAVGAEARERHALAVETDAARVRAWGGEPVDVGRRDGCYPLFAFAAALVAATRDDHALRRTIGRIGLLDRVATFDADDALHDRIETVWADLMRDPPPPPGPPRDELLALCDAAGRRP
jgi:hypothetical protein